MQTGALKSPTAQFLEKSTVSILSFNWAKGKADMRVKLNALLDVVVAKSCGIVLLQEFSKESYVQVNEVLDGKWSSQPLFDFRFLYFDSPNQVQRGAQPMACIYDSMLFDCNNPPQNYLEYRTPTPPAKVSRYTPPICFSVCDRLNFDDEEHQVPRCELNLLNVHLQSGRRVTHSNNALANIIAGLSPEQQTSALIVGDFNLVKNQIHGIANWTIETTEKLSHAMYLSCLLYTSPSPRD